MLRRLVAVGIAVALGFTGCADSAAEDDDKVGSSEAALVKPAEVNRFWQRYTRDKEDIEKQWRSDNGGRPWGGDYLAWKESFLETALVDMYAATKDVAFLDELVKRADVVFSLRDDRINRKDEVRGKIVPAWGRFPDVGRTTRTGDWVCEMVQNGLITFPIAEFVHYADNSQGLRQHFGADKIDRYRDRLVETVDAFDADWDDNGGQGFYRFPNGYAKVYPPHEGRYLPYNRALLMGRTMIMLEASNIGDARKAKYRERVRNMAKFFLDDAKKVDSDSRLVWGYATWEQSPEDIAHGGLDVDFFAVAASHDYSSVGRADVDRFIGTFKQVSRDPNKIARSVDGHIGGGDQKDANEACGRYLDLAAHDASLVKRCEKVIADGFDERQIGFAKTLRYRR